MVFNVAVQTASLVTVSPAVKCHHNVAIPVATAMKQIPIVRRFVPVRKIVHVVNNARVANVARNVVSIVPAQLVNYVNVVPVLPAVSQMATVPLIRFARMDNVRILVPKKMRVDVMLIALCRTIACSAIAPMAMKVSRAKSAYNLNVIRMKIVNRINVAIVASAVILAWNMEHVVLMHSVVLSIVYHSVRVLQTSLESPKQNVILWMAVVRQIRVAPIQSVLRYPVGMNVPAWVAAWEMHTKDAYAKIIW